ncbi:nucleotidyltransferase family protein [Anaerolinea thermophila]|uniref:MobA-like NTP transferase domain-containing protein n=1 Tax=Anaerolinea thermophila (strain DSM 14523 / JCM 11388 / NBRC 100420 / UNI-1) TaxID=926569 RepID=E8N4W7_ANATU|nr:nucleotidyltransferase family protein [Anaerolinea thermophila]BAJ63481.1 hypothetical protein ANT_14530 [Anaerolinea thermophila UNI-1]
MMTTKSIIGAVVLAAGMSRRMGQPKQLLPWGKTTVIGQVVNVLQAAQVAQIVVVTGKSREQVEQTLKNTSAQCVFNPRYETSEMLTSLKVGISRLHDEVQAVLVVLGDQPQIQVSVVQGLIEQYRLGKGVLIVPSYQMRRGHPWLVDRSLWQEILQMDDERESMRNFLNHHAQDIVYYLVDTPSILTDMDTPEDYQQMRPVDERDNE